MHAHFFTERRTLWICLVQRSRKSGYASVGACDLIGLSRFSRPCGTAHLSSLSPGLRPGLNSARPCGTRRRAEIRKVTASPDDKSKYALLADSSCLGSTTVLNLVIGMT